MVCIRYSPPDKGNFNKNIRWSVLDTAHLINKGNFNKNIRWSVLDTAHLIITRHVILVWNKYRWAGQLTFETK